MSMVEYANRELNKAEKEGFLNYDPGDYAECMKCKATTMEECIKCPVASYDYKAPGSDTVL